MEIPAQPAVSVWARAGHCWARAGAADTAMVGPALGHVRLRAYQTACCSQSHKMACSAQRMRMHGDRLIGQHGATGATPQFKIQETRAELMMHQVGPHAGRGRQQEPADQQHQCQQGQQPTSTQHFRGSRSSHKAAMSGTMAVAGSTGVQWRQHRLQEYQAARKQQSTGAFNAKKPSCTQQIYTPTWRKHPRTTHSTISNHPVMHSITDKTSPAGA